MLQSFERDAKRKAKEAPAAAPAAAPKAKRPRARGPKAAVSGPKEGHARSRSLDPGGWPEEGCLGRVIYEGRAEVALSIIGRLRVQTEATLSTLCMETAV